MNVQRRNLHAPDSSGLSLIEEGAAFAALTEDKTVLSGTPRGSSLLSSSRISEYAFAFQRTAALRAAIELDLFTAIADGHTTPAALAQHCGAAERGIRILCDYLGALGLLTRKGEHYLAAQDAAAYLSRRSPAFVGDALGFTAFTTALNPLLSDPAAADGNGEAAFGGRRPR